MPNPAPKVVFFPTKSGRDYYDNAAVETLVIQHVQDGCTSIKLRDQIMEHAPELISQIIEKTGLRRIYGRDAASLQEMISIAQIQIERTLYKFKAAPHCASCYDPLNPPPSRLYMPEPREYGILTAQDVADRQLRCRQCGCLPPAITYRGLSKIFNMWSGVARTVILAHIKKDKRDRHHSRAFSMFKERETQWQPVDMARFWADAVAVCAGNPVYIDLLGHLEDVVASDPNPWTALARKLLRSTAVLRPDRYGGLLNRYPYNRTTIDQFLLFLRQKVGAFELETTRATAGTDVRWG